MRNKIQYFIQTDSLHTRKILAIKILQIYSQNGIAEQNRKYRVQNDTQKEQREEIKHLLPRFCMMK